MSTCKLSTFVKNYYSINQFKRTVFCQIVKRIMTVSVWQMIYLLYLKPCMTVCMKFN